MKGFFKRRSGGAGAPDGAAARQEIIQALQLWVVSRRPAWRAEVAEGEPTGSISKFWGISWLTDAESGPTCKECGRELQLFVQLVLESLPDEAATMYGSGVLQLFYCVGEPLDAPDDKPECFADDAWAPFSDTSSLVRVVPAGALKPSAQPTAQRAEFPPLTIVGWERFDGLPDAQDHEMAGLSSCFSWTPMATSPSCSATRVSAM